VTVLRGRELAASGWLEPLLALERETMAPLLRETGDAFPEARRRAGLGAEDALIVLVHQGEALAAAAHFVPDWNDPADLYVASVQVSPRARGGAALRRLLGAAAGAVELLPWRRVTTNVHPSNTRALVLAERLGFRRVDALGRDSVRLALERAEVAPGLPEGR